MSDRWSNKKLIEFVKNTLGCGCPEKVFEKIDVSQHQAAANTDKITRIVIGDTLLIYILCLDSDDVFTDSVLTLCSEGMIDRDTHNYNRFRLVLSGAGGLAQKEKISERFATAFDDEKMHIHFVDDALIAGLQE